MRASPDTSSPIRTLDILELIANEGPAAHTLISARLGIPKSTATSLLKSLVNGGYVLRGEDRKFMLAPRVLRLSEGFLAQRQWLLPLLPLLDRLRNETRETAFLLERRGDQRVIIARRMVDEGLSFTIPVGDMAPLSGTAGGHALLRPGETVIGSDGSPEGIERTAEGVHFAPSAIVVGVSSFAVALRVPADIPPLAFSLAMPDIRLTSAVRTHIETALAGVRDSAEAILGTA